MIRGIFQLPKKLSKKFRASHNDLAQIVVTNPSQIAVTEND